MLPDSLLSSALCSSLVSFSFLLQLAVSITFWISERGQMASSAGITLSLSFSLSSSSLSRSLALSLSLSLCPELNCVGLSVLSWLQLSVQGSWVSSWAPLAMWRPLPSYHSASSSLQSIFNAPSLLSHSEHTLGILQRDPLTRPCKNSSTAGY